MLVTRSPRPRPSPCARPPTSELDPPLAPAGGVEPAELDPRLSRSFRSSAVESRCPSVNWPMSVIARHGDRNPSALTSAFPPVGDKRRAAGGGPSCRARGGCALGASLPASLGPRPPDVPAMAPGRTAAYQLCPTSLSAGSRGTISQETATPVRGVGVSGFPAAVTPAGGSGGARHHRHGRSTHVLTGARGVDATRSGRHRHRPASSRRSWRAPSCHARRTPGDRATLPLADHSPPRRAAWPAGLWLGGSPPTEADVCSSPAV